MLLVIPCLVYILSYDPNTKSMQNAAQLHMSVNRSRLRWLPQLCLCHPTKLVSLFKNLIDFFSNVFLGVRQNRVAFPKMVFFLLCFWEYGKFEASRRGTRQPPDKLQLNNGRQNEIHRVRKRQSVLFCEISAPRHICHNAQARTPSCVFSVVFWALENSIESRN